MDIGQLERTYDNSRTKILINGVLAIILIGFGVLSIVVGSGTLILLIGIAALVGGLSFMISTFLRNVGRRISVYTHGVAVKVRNQTSQYRYEAISGLQVEALQQGGNRFALIDFAFYKDGKPLFAIGPVYDDWREGGQLLVEKVSDIQARLKTERIQDGYEVVFDELSGSRLGHQLVVKANLQGVVEVGKDVLPWERVGYCETDTKSNDIVIYDVDSNPYSRFRYYNTTNSIIAMKIINQMVQVRGKR